MSTPTSNVTTPAAGTYSLDAATSVISFKTRHLFGLGGVDGTFGVTGGTVRIAEPATASSIVATASTKSFSSGSSKRDDEIVSAAWLDAASFPEISFTSTGISQTDGRWLVTGDLAARGNAAPVTLTVTEVTPTATGVQLQAVGKVDRYAHGITAKKGMAGRWLQLTLTSHATRL